MAGGCSDLMARSDSERIRGRVGVRRLFLSADVTGRIAMHTGDDQGAAPATVVRATRGVVRSAARARNIGDLCSPEPMARSLG
jgi:hypothetical protein